MKWNYFITDLQYLGYLLQHETPRSRICVRIVCRQEVTDNRFIGVLFNYVQEQLLILLYLIPV
jgi:hypothetical protein